ncbi:MAG: hypothetical protein ACREYF_11400 [Gammaproteobacteria bacterium]
MAFIWWTLFIISFFITFFIIITTLLKKYHGWQAFYVILSVFNLLAISLYLPLLLEPKILNNNSHGPLFIMGFLGLFARLYMLRALGIIDIMSILLYSVHRFLYGEVQKVGYIIWFVISLIIFSHIYDAFYLINKLLLSIGL